MANRNDSGDYPGDAYSAYLAREGVWTEGHPWTPGTNYPLPSVMPRIEGFAFPPVSQTRNTWQEAVVHRPGTLRMLQNARQMSGSIKLQPSRSYSAGTVFPIPTQLGLAIRNGAAPPIPVPPYTGPYPRSTSNQYPGIFQRYPLPRHPMGGTLDNKGKNGGVTQQLTTPAALSQGETTSGLYPNGSPASPQSKNGNGGPGRTEARRVNVAAWVVGGLALFVWSRWRK